MNGFIDENKINGVIRFFLYVLIFWLPYSPAVVESCVIIGMILWMIKRGMVAGQQQNLTPSINERFFRYCKCFKLTPSPINRPVAFFLSACFLSVIGSAFFEQSWHNFLTKTLEWFIVYFLVIEVFQKKKHIYIAIFILLFTSGATALDSIVQFHITQKDVFLGHMIEPGSRATAGFKTANGLGAYLTVIIPLILALIFFKGKNLRFRFFVSLTFLLAVWSLIVTFSRGAWLGTLLGIMFFPLVFCFHDQLRKFYFALGLVCVTTVLYVYFGLMFTSSFDLEVLVRHSTVDWRLNIWQDGIRMIKDKPFFGHGINTFMQIFKFYRSDINTNPTYAHNCYIQLAAETGLFGLLSFLWIIGNLFRESFKKVTFFATHDSHLMILSSGLLSGIFAFLVHSFFDTNFYSLQLSVYLWCVIGLLMAIHNMKRLEKENVCVGANVR